MELSRASVPLTPIQGRARSRLMGKLADGTYRLEDVVSCLCGGVDSRALASHDRFGIPVGVVLCTDCGLARTSPRLAAAHLGAFYEHDYHGLHFGIEDPDPSTALFRRGQGNAIHALLSAELAPGRLRVADVGAGTGQVLREFADVHGDIEGVGCEYSTAFVSAGRRAGTEMRQGGPEVLDGPFDVVILSHVVEHLPDPVADLAAVRSLAHERTLFYVEVPGLLTIDRKPEYAYSLAQYLTLAHTYHFTRETLAATMARAGFVEVLGDETVRSVYRSGLITEPMPDRATGITIQSSLARLNRPSIRIRGLAWRLRQVLAITAKAVLPASLVRSIRSWR
jgi:SAM-dependent methyltransferase